MSEVQAILIELDEANAQIMGRASNAAGSAIGFSGWLELAAALERLRTAQEPAGEASEA